MYDRWHLLDLNIFQFNSTDHFSIVLFSFLINLQDTEVPEDFLKYEMYLEK